jgi:hypothetical protein
MKRKLLYTLMFGSIVMLTACGGGGGGGGASYVNPNPSSGGGIQGQAPVTTTTSGIGTPTLVATINPLVVASSYGSALNTFSADLANSGTPNIVVAGDCNGCGSSNHVNSTITVFGWSNGSLVNQTSQWFSGTDNVIVGTPKVSFGDFNGSGRQSMFIAPGTDGQVSSNTVQMFVNNGTTFTRYDVALPHPIDSYDSAVFNWHGVDNAVALAYPYTEVIMGSNTNNFKAYAVSNVSGASIASGNFLGTGAPSFIVGQYGSSTTLGAQPDALVGFNYDPVADSVTMPFIRNMPTPLFNTSPYFAQTGGSNTIKVVKMDFDESGVDSAFIIAMPNNWQTSPWQSSIQFLKNNGSGVFTDVTATTVTGYNMNLGPSFNPVIIDLLNTGLPDIVLPAAGGTQVLTQVSKGQYVGSMANVISNFTGQIQPLLTQGQSSTNSTVTFVKGPNNDLYLLGMVPETLNGSAANQFYLSKLTGNTVALNAQQAITAAKTAWPWLTNTQLNTMIVATGSSFAGVPVINDQALLSPSGSLSVFNKPIQGYLAGINMNSSDSNITAMDSLGRTFNANLSGMHMSGWSNSFNTDTEHIDQYELTSHTEYLINGAVNSYGPVRVGSETRNQFNTLNMSDPTLGPTIGYTPINYTFGIPRLWQSGNWSGGTQYTTLNYNPWLAFGGSWGMVTQTGNFDTTLRYNEGGFSAVAGSTYTTTNMTPGLITRVSDIYGVWGEAGYHFSNDIGVYAGVKPVVISGNVQANLPTGVDNAGNLQYTGKTLALQNQTTGYVRALWGTELNRQTFYRISGTVMSNGQYRLMNELRYSFD